MSDVCVSFDNTLKIFNLGEDMLQQSNVSLDTAERQYFIDQSSRTYKKHCFYCHHTYKTSRTAFIDHLFQHGFQLGKPNKLLYIERLINIVESLFLSYRCLYCLIQFDTKSEMINHMNGNRHNRINPDNKFFDQFYIINYRYRQPQEYCNVEDEYINDDRSDAVSTPATLSIICLFCDHSFHGITGFKLHNVVFHQFNFDEVISQFHLDDQIKAINFIRKKVSDFKCMFCNEKFNSKTVLLNHMEKNAHYRLPERLVWDDMYFHSPTNDSLIPYLQGPYEKTIYDEMLNNTSNRLIKLKH